MSKQPPAPILKMDLLSSAIAGDATPHRVKPRQSLIQLASTCRRHYRWLHRPQQGACHVCRWSALHHPQSKRLLPSHRSSQACRLACGSAKCGSRLPLNASFAFDPFVRYKVPDVGAVVTQAQDKVSLLPLPRRVTHTRIGSCKFGACS